MKRLLCSLNILMLASGALVAQTPRLCLYEEFTGETCPPCASANPILNALLAQPKNAAKVVAIKWQVPIPSAPTKTWSLYQTNKAEIDWRYRSVASGGYGYAINSAPSGKMDGRNVTDFGAGSNHPSALNSNVIHTAASYTSAFSVDIQRSWDQNLSAVNLTISIEATAPFDAVGNLMFRTVMVERLITFSVQPGTNGEKVFEDVAIRSFPTTKSGTVVTGMGTTLPANWIKGQTHTFTLNCPVPAYTRKLTEIAFVGFIQDDGDKKVAQAFRAEPQGIDPNDARVVKVKGPGMSCTSAFTPTITVHNNGANAITSMVLNPFIDGVAGTPVTWNGNLDNGASMTLTMSAVSSTLAGGHTFSVNISSVSGGDANTANNTGATSYFMGTGSKGLSVAEDFQGAAFPPAGWANLNEDNGPGWTQATGPTIGGYATSTASTRYDFFNNPIVGDVDELYLSPLNLYGNAVPDMEFEFSYRQRSANSNDKLEILASDDCGQTWTSFFSRSGAALSTVPGTLETAFTPSSSAEWTFESLKLTGMNKQDVLVKFVVTNDNGNNLYIDNVNIRQSDPQTPSTTGLGESAAGRFSAMVFPNPSSGSVTLKITAPAGSAATVSVMNTLGQVVFRNNVSLLAGSNSLALDLQGLADGIYEVSVESDAAQTSTKLNIIK